MRAILAIVFFALAAFSGEPFIEGIIKKNLQLQPADLVKEYVKRDANGDFLETNEWWNSAVACPACMGGPDTFTVISSYDIKQIDGLKYSVVYQVEGKLSGDKFSPNRKSESHSFSVVKTDWGYKLDQKAYQMVYAHVASEKFKSKLSKQSLKTLNAVRVQKAGE